MQQINLHSNSSDEERGQSTEILRDKLNLREYCKMRVAELEQNYTDRASEIICAKLLNLHQYKAAKTVFCFVGTKNEIDTLKFIQNVLYDKKTLCVPRCIAKNTQESGDVKADDDDKAASRKKGSVSGIMHAKKVESTGQLKAGFFGILEPPEIAPTINPNEIDLIILPCLAAEKTGARLGYGGGFYDRYLQNVRTGCAKILICRNKLILPNGTIPLQPHDVFADMVISEVPEL